jgi:hypothetical protein
VLARTRGWDELATVLYTRARGQLTEEEATHSPVVELRHMAWSYWAGTLTERAPDRAAVLHQLRELAAADPTLRSAENQTQ